MCPQLTEGPNCSQCSANSFGWEANRGCQVSAAIRRQMAIHVALRYYTRYRNAVAIRSERSTDIVITRPGRVSVGLATTVPSVTNARLVITGIPGADLVPVTPPVASRTNATGRCAIATNSDSVNARYVNDPTRSVGKVDDHS